MKIKKYYVQGFPETNFDQEYWDQVENYTEERVFVDDPLVMSSEASFFL